MTPSASAAQDGVVRTAPPRLLALSLSLSVGLGLGAAPGAALTAAELDAGAQTAASGAKRHVKKLASNRMKGRDNDTRGSRLAQAYLVKRLAKICEPLGSGPKPYLQPFLRDGDAGANLLCVIRGRELPDEHVMLGGHYDHLGVGGCGPETGTSDRICNGATDNAAGTAAVLAVGNAVAKLPEAPRRSIVLALWDAQEDGLEGSEHYVEEAPLVPLSQTAPLIAPTYADAVSLQKLLALAVPADLGLFPPSGQVEIAEVGALIDQLVADGPAAFDGADAVSVFTSAAVLIAYLEGLPCPAW